MYKSICINVILGLITYFKYGIWGSTLEEEPSVGENSSCIRPSNNPSHPNTASGNAE